MWNGWGEVGQGSTKTHDDINKNPPMNVRKGGV